MTAAPTQMQDLPIKVTVEPNDEIVIEWDETHPLAISLGLDNWTEEQWNDAIETGFSDIVAAQDADKLNG